MRPCLHIHRVFYLETASPDIYSLSLHDALPIWDGLIRVRNIRALNGRFNTSITHAYSIVIGSKHITLNATDNNTVGMGDEIGRAVQQECRDRSRMPSSA